MNETLETILSVTALIGGTGLILVVFLILYIPEENFLMNKEGWIIMVTIPRVKKLKLILTKIKFPATFINKKTIVNL